MLVHQRPTDGLRARQALEEAIPWRRRSLLHAGFPAPLAASVAADLRLDLHAVLELVDRGCPPDLAIQILEPWRGEVGS